MAELTRYRVLRNHDGDRFYTEGEMRDARSDDVKHLVGRVLEEIGPVPAEKADDPPANKAEAGAPANKAETTSPGKKNRKRGGK